MSIESLLEELVSSLQAATGAIVLEADGESVGWYAIDGERLRLRGAYLSVLLQSCVNSPGISTLGSTLELVLEYEGAKLVVSKINDDSFIVLELSSASNIAEAIFRLGPVVEQLRDEFGS